MTGWREERDRAVAARARALEEQRAAESRRARQQISDFLKRALAAGLATEPLRCRSYDGRASYRTPLNGWYLNQARTVAVDTDGEFYTLTVPRSLAARVKGVRPQPQAPPLIVGEGGRDGESMPLRDLLDKRLAA
ncbi:MAG TPA: hypothetical protein VF062_05570 [Candidatus Limnocylindrales bacterium]